MTLEESSVRRWVATAAADLVWSRFAEGAAVYHRPSGKTHFLNAASITLIDFLSSQPRSVAAIAEYLAATHEDAGDTELHGTVDRVLTELERLGLASRAS